MTSGAALNTSISSAGGPLVELMLMMRSCWSTASSGMSAFQSATKPSVIPAIHGLTEALHGFASFVEYVRSKPKRPGFLKYKRRFTGLSTVSSSTLSLSFRRRSRKCCATHGWPLIFAIRSKGKTCFALCLFQSAAAPSQLARITHSGSERSRSKRFNSSRLPICITCSSSLEATGKMGLVSSTLTEVQQNMLHAIQLHLK
mmetsp:Transcript_26571/g.32309  ORF Transcript_26571/g.32309 Transcript_26571/m.32309 type:complete len:201 (-) Transcript_26571:20-622(-)